MYVSENYWQLTDNLQYFREIWMFQENLLIILEKADFLEMWRDLYK